MMKPLLILWLFLLFPVLLSAQRLQLEEAILHLSGEREMEALSEDVLEQFLHYESHPLPINYLSANRLAETPLLTSYQAASLVDYRERHGDILSLAELALVDGFSREDAEALRFFLRFDSALRPGEQAPKRRTSHYSLLLRDRWSGENDFRLKARLDIGEGFSAGYALPNNFYLQFYSSRRHFHFILGDYRLRLGQGLLFWDGFRLSGYSSLTSVLYRGAGVSPALSFSSEGLRRGWAWGWNRGHWRLDLFGCVPGLREGKQRSLLLGGRAALLLRRGSLGANAFVQSRGSAGARGDLGFSVDGQYHLHAWDVYGEAAWLPLDRLGLYSLSLRSPSWGSWAAAAILRRERQRREMALVGQFGRAYQPFQAVLSLSRVRKKEALPQWKLRAETVWQFSPFFRWKSRYTYSLSRPASPGKSELRLDGEGTRGPWLLNQRLHFSHAASLGLMGYLEGGYKRGPCGLYLRGMVFRVDQWADRIYAWERDAPQNFSLPLCYGRGFRISALSAWRFAWKQQRWKLYAKGSWVAYPWMAVQKAGKAEVKITFCWEG